MPATCAKVAATLMNSSKLLAIKLRSLGDTVLMTAPLTELTRAYPHSEIHVVVPQEWASLFSGFPGIYKVWPWTRGKSTLAKMGSLASLAADLRKENFETVINFHASPSSSLLARSTGAKTRSVHFHGHHDKNRHSTVIIPGKGILKPIIERDMDAIRALGLHIPAGLSPKLFLHSTEKQGAFRYLQGQDLPQPILGLGLGASRPTKSWPIERFASLAVEWALKTGGGCFALAGPSEEGLLQRFLTEVTEIIKLSEIPPQIRSKISGTHQLHIRELAALLTQVAVLTANDSGPKHLAVAVGTPTVTLFGPEHPFEWHPYPLDRHPYFFIEPLDCRKSAAPQMPPWCGLEVCQTEDHRCMNQIGVNLVLQQCLEIAGKEAPAL